MLDNNTPPPTPRQLGSRNLAKSLLKGLQRPHAKHLLPKRGGWHATKAAADWVQPGFELQCKELKGGELIHAVECMGFHSAKPWTSSDTMKMADLDARSFTFAYLNRRKGGYRPKTHKRIVKSLHGGKLRFAAGYYDFVWDCLEAIRVGAVSVHLSAIEAGELYEVTSRTFERWVVAAEEVGVIRILNTQAKNNRVRRNRHRRQGKNCYFAGPALAQAYGAAIYEGCDKEVIGDKLAAAARAQGAILRKLCRQDAHARKNLAWVEKFKPPTTSTLSSDSLSDPPSPDGSEIGARMAGKVEEWPVATVWPAAPDRDGKPHSRTRDVASLETNENSTGQKRPEPESTPIHLASSGKVDAITAVESKSDDDSGELGRMLEMGAELMARLAGPTKRGFHTLLFLIALASTACGAVLDGQTKTDRESGDRATARTHGIASTTRGAREPTDADSRPARVRGGRRPAGGRQGGYSGGNLQNADTGRPAAINWSVRRPDRTKMDETSTEITNTSGTIRKRQTDGGDHLHMEAECNDGDQIFSWDIERPVVVTSRRLEGLLAGKPRDAKIVAYARLDDPKWRSIMLENLGSTRLPGRLQPGTHSIRVISEGAKALRISLNCREDFDIEKERESSSRNANPTEQMFPHGASTGDALVREADIMKNAIEDSGRVVNDYVGELETRVHNLRSAVADVTGESMTGHTDAELCGAMLDHVQRLRLDNPSQWLSTEQRDASVIPQVTEQDGKTVCVTVCDSMSGGAQEIDGMPRRLSLIRWRDDVELRADYTMAEHRAADQLEHFARHDVPGDQDTGMSHPELDDEAVENT